MRYVRLFLAGAAAAALAAGAAGAQTSPATQNTTGSTTYTGAVGATGQGAATGQSNTTGQSNMSGSSSNMTGQSNMTGSSSTMTGQSNMTGSSSNTTGASTMAPAGPYREIAASPSSSIVAILQGSGQFTVLLKALQATNLTSVLQGPGALTLFAPTDAAFQALPAGQLDTLMKPENAPQLQKLLTYHLVNLPITSAKLKGKAATNENTVNGKAVHLDDTSGTFKVNDASVIQSDVKASNGTIQVIDHVLSTDYVVPAVTAAPAATADDTQATTAKSTGAKSTSTKKAARKRKGG